MKINTRIQPVSPPPAQSAHVVADNQNNGSKASQQSVAAPPLNYPLPGTIVQPNKRDLRIVVGGVVAATLIIAYFVAVLWRLQTPSTPVREIKPDAPPTMAYVPGGEFLMGRNNGDEYERPQHKVIVKPFYIDLYEVTCEEYGKFVKATGHTSPPNWKDGQYPAGAARQPVTGVNWDDASAYARWAGKRLPTEEEWEFAARSGDGRRYPWGNEWRADAANADGSSQNRVVDVGSYPAGKSPFGAFDMVGNAWEWTASDLRAYPGGRLPAKLTDNMKVIRGNFWGSKSDRAMATFRRGWPARGDYEYKNTGFRCAKDSTPSAVGE